MDIQIKSSRAVLATDNAVKKLVQLKSEETSEDSFLRMGVKPGGCSGYSYEMFFDTDKFDGDVIEEYDGVNIVVDGQSLEHIKGATLDYKEGLMETGFSIDNPNVSRTCGCGNCFNPTISFIAQLSSKSSNMNINSSCPTKIVITPNFF